MYEPSRHVTSFNIAGFQHWDGATVLSELAPGMVLALDPEPFQRLIVFTRAKVIRATLAAVAGNQKRAVGVLPFLSIEDQELTIVTEHSEPAPAGAVFNQGS